MSAKIHIHSEPRQTIVPLLSPYIEALPLIRRIQFHLQSPSAIVLATFPPSATSLPSEYAISYVDRSRAPETECWLFSSAEFPSPPSAAQSPESLQRSRSQLLSILNQINQLPLPDTYPPTQDRALLLTGAVSLTTLSLLKNSPINPSSGQKIISAPQAALSPDPDSRDPQYSQAHLAPSPAAEAGDHIHGSTSAGNKAQKGVVRGHTVPYAKFIFPPGTYSLPADTEVTGGSDGLPEGMVWARIRREELALVISRTEIPRKERTLGVLPGVGVRVRGGEEEEEGDGRLVAWAFLGVDGSLTSLHVEEGFRGMGLAKALTRRVFALLMPGRDVVPSRGEGDGMLGDPRMGFAGIEEGGNHAHSDVARDNAASIGVAKALGGEEGWECFWSWIDLEAVGEAVSEV